MKEIPLYGYSKEKRLDRQGRLRRQRDVVVGQSIIDDDDYELVSKYKWNLSKSGYVVTNIKQDDEWKYIKLHRLVMNAPEGVQVDHIHGNKLDNRKSELRLCNNSQNHANVFKIQHRKGKPCSSKFKGVCWDRGAQKWRVGIRKDGRQTHLGFFDEQTDAARAYDNEAKKRFGEFCWLNFPENKQLTILDFCE